MDVINNETSKIKKSIFLLFSCIQKACTKISMSLFPKCIFHVLYIFHWNLKALNLGLCIYTQRCNRKTWFCGIQWYPLQDTCIVCCRTELAANYKKNIYIIRFCLDVERIFYCVLVFVSYIHGPGMILKMEPGIYESYKFIDKLIPLAKKYLLEKEPRNRDEP